MASVLCPRCGTPRVGKSPFCRNCGLDYDGLGHPVGSSCPCPYGCGHVFSPALARKRTCPSCGRDILVQDYQAKTVAQVERDRMAPQVERLGFNFDDLQTELLAEDPNIAPEDVYSAALARKVAQEVAAENWGAAADGYRSQGLLLKDRGRPHLEVAHEEYRARLRAVMKSVSGLAGLNAAVTVASQDCCADCQQANGVVVDAAAELVSPSLPHERCPMGCLCAYEWELEEPTEEELRATDALMRGLGFEVRFGADAEVGVVIRDGVETPLVQIPVAGPANGLPIALAADVDSTGTLVTWPDGSLIQIGQPAGVGRLLRAWAGGYLTTSDGRMMHGNWGPPGGPWHGCGCISPTPRRFVPDPSAPEVTEPARYGFVGEIHPDYEGVEPEGLICGRCSRAIPAQRLIEDRGDRPPRAAHHGTPAARHPVRTAVPRRVDPGQPREGQPEGVGRVQAVWDDGYFITSDQPRGMYGNIGRRGGPGIGCGCKAPTPRLFAPDPERPQDLQPVRYQFVGRIRDDYAGTPREGVICGRCNRALSEGS